MKPIRSAVAGLTVGLAVSGVALTLPSMASASPSEQATAVHKARPKWSSSGLSNVAASGEYSRSGNRVHLYGTVRDTGNKWYNACLQISIRNPHEKVPERFAAKGGNGSSARVDFQSQNAPHLWIRECRGGAIQVGLTVGPWKKIY